MNRTLPVLAAAVFAVALAGCTAGAAPTPAPTAATAAVPTPEPTPDPLVGSTAAAVPGAAEWTMPDLVGMNLQAAQDHLQAVTDYGVPLSTSTDATGRGRQQIMDRNWVVCSQTPAAGETISNGVVPDLTAVKDDESC